MKDALPDNKILESYPLLKKLGAFTREAPNIKKHYAERKYSRYSLLYFDFAGRGEVARVALKHAGVEFEDKMVSMDEWPKLKQNSKFF